MTHPAAGGSLPGSGSPVDLVLDAALVVDPVLIAAVRTHDLETRAAEGRGVLVVGVEDGRSVGGVDGVEARLERPGVAASSAVAGVSGERGHAAAPGRHAQDAGDLAGV